MFFEKMAVPNMTEKLGYKPRPRRTALLIVDCSWLMVHRNSSINHQPSTEFPDFRQGSIKNRAKGMTRKFVQGMQ